MTKKELEEENKELKFQISQLEFDDKLKCELYEKVILENQILKDGIKALNLSLGYDEGNKKTGYLNGYCVVSITPQKEAFILLCGTSDNQEVVDRYNKIKEMLEVINNE